MCGIAGVFYADREQLPDPEVLHTMSARLSHRGPDGEGLWTDGGVGLLHRRLSIIDLATGSQPMSNEDGTIQVVFNGEIYNFAELRQRLETNGHRFRTNSDTEVIVHLYEDLGADLVSHLRGMFAFALWDSIRRRLVLARDRVGIKPLYIYRDSSKVVFASELKAILAHPDVATELDVTALEDYLAFGMTTGARSIFKRIEKVLPGHLLVLTADALGCAPQRYWHLQFAPRSEITVSQWIEELRAKVTESVRGHLLADVPVGAFLSGGLDSSVVTLTAASLQPGIHTFSVGFDGQTDELPYARLIAGRYGTTHTEETVTADAVSLLDDLSYHFDEPFADSSAVPTYLVSKAARSHVKVALSGDGGDEAFGGYARYAHDLKEARLRDMLPAWLRRSLIATMARHWPKADRLPRPLRAKTLLTNISLPAAAAYANTLTICRQPLRRQLLARDLQGSLNGYDPEPQVRNAYLGAPAADALAGMIGADVGVVLPDDYLVKVDRASMAHGLEVRPPLLDHELLELSARIPSRYKVSRGETKWLLKQAYSTDLPHALLHRPKRGFEMPLDRWMAGPLRPVFEAMVLHAVAPVSGLIDQQTARGLFRDHVKGRARNGQILWTLLVLATWAERYLRSPATPSDRATHVHASAPQAP